MIDFLIISTKMMGEVGEKTGLGTNLNIDECFYWKFVRKRSENIWVSGAAWKLKIE